MLFRKIWRTSFIIINIISAFKVIGIFPLNPNRFFLKISPFIPSQPPTTPQKSETIILCEIIISLKTLETIRSYRRLIRDLGPQYNQKIIQKLSHTDEKWASKANIEEYINKRLRKTIILLKKK